MNDSTHATHRWSTSTMLRISSGADLPTAAMRLANLGIPVFPCVPGGKQPLTPNGFHDASWSARTIDAWWRRTPDANIGLPTGMASGVLVVDVDIHPSGSGFEAFERACAAQLADGWGWLVRTPSGGLHAYYPSPGRRSSGPGRCRARTSTSGAMAGMSSSRLRASRLAASPRAYRVIAVAQHQPRAIDARSLREFLEPPRPTPPPRSLPALGSRPDKLADWVARADAASRLRSVLSDLAAARVSGAGPVLACRAQVQPARGFRTEPSSPNSRLTDARRPCACVHRSFCAVAARAGPRCPRARRLLAPQHAARSRPRADRAEIAAKAVDRSQRRHRASTAQRRWHCSIASLRPAPMSIN